MTDDEKAEVTEVTEKAPTSKRNRQAKEADEAVIEPPAEEETEEELISYDEAFKALGTWEGLTAYWESVVDTALTIKYATGDFPHSWMDFRRMVATVMSGGDL